MPIVYAVLVIFGVCWWLFTMDWTINDFQISLIAVAAFVPLIALGGVAFVYDPVESALLWLYIPGLVLATLASFWPAKRHEVAERERNKRAARVASIVHSAAARPLPHERR